MRESVWFISEWKTGEIFLTNYQATYSMGFTDKSAREVLSVKHPPERKPHCSTLEAYEETPIFILVDNMDDVVESIARKRSGSSWNVGMDLEVLQGWLPKFRDDRKKLCISVELFLDWWANQNSPWAAYWEFTSGRLIVSDKQPGVHPVGVRETWRQLFAKYVLKVTGPVYTYACKHEQLCTELMMVTNGVVHGDQYIWGDKSTN